MRFWFRELAGWLLVGLGLYVFLVVFATLLDPAPRLLEAGPLTLIGLIVFRGGIHLLKVAMAARVCMHAQAEAERERKPPARAARAKETDAAWDW